MSLSYIWDKFNLSSPIDTIKSNLKSQLEVFAGTLKFKTEPKVVVSDTVSLSPSCSTAKDVEYAEVESGMLTFFSV